MQRTINYIICVLLVSVTLIGCSSEPSLQRYFVDNQETKNFLSQDLPISMLKIDESKLNETQKEAYKSVKRLNFLGYKISDTNVEEFNTELAKVKAILQNKKYNELIEFRDKGNKISVKYVGNDDEADEVILLGSSKDYGFAVVRILGNNMRPNKIYTLVEAMQHSNLDKSQFEGIADFFK
ncbi:DUF4252 domain-containing protein [Postechiella marina]|uniref:DUF4252 domain-containing protein n=1 Tax=Postechiella marina TaxID=943941 RepID=A0ABP8CGE2_9FLAO